MRHNYVGDNGDHLKYGLIRELCQDDLHLGIIWYLTTHAEATVNHGSKTAYLNNPKNAVYDPELFAALKAIAHKEHRSVVDIRESNIFRPSTIFYEEALNFEDIPEFLARRRYRKRWFEGAYRATETCDVVFLDPDTGLEIKSKDPFRDIEGPKYLSYDEIAPFLERNQTVIIYQHTQRQHVPTQIKQIIKNLKEHLDYQNEVLNVWLKWPSEGDGRIFLILPAPHHQKAIGQRLTEYKTSAWADFVRE